MNLRVKPKTVQLPHTISRAGIQYQFAPDCEVPDDYGLALLKTAPHLYEVAKGDPDLKLYTFTDQFKNKSVADIVSKLNDEGKLKVFNFAKRVAQGEPQPDEGPSPIPLSQDQSDLLESFAKLTDDDKAAVFKYIGKKLGD